MIKTEIYEQALFETIKRGATVISDDVKEAFEAAIKRESNPDAKNGLMATLRSMEMSAKRENPLCVDTGWPIFYFKVGNQCELEGGFVELENAARRAVAKATKKGYLRATMKHPLTGYDPGNNIGMNIPDFTYQFVDGNGIEITYAAKGGGSECFGGTRHRMIAFADGIKGIEKFVIDSFVASARAGAVCPPSVLGIGIGGDFEQVAEMAKRALMIPLDENNPDSFYAELEQELLAQRADADELMIQLDEAYTTLSEDFLANEDQEAELRQQIMEAQAEGVGIRTLMAPDHIELDKEGKTAGSGA